MVLKPLFANHNSQKLKTRGDITINVLRKSTWSESLSSLLPDSKNKRFRVYIEQGGHWEDVETHDLYGH